MNLYAKSKFNPTPLSKLFVTVFLSVCISFNTSALFSFALVAFISVFCMLNSKSKLAIKSITIYLLLNILSFDFILSSYDFLKNYVLFLVIVAKFFYLPFLGGIFFVATSDVSSIIVSLEKVKLPKTIIIPLSVIFRYFPTFKEDRKSIKDAMKMRGITFKNPIRYLEYVSVPTIISATNIIDDISISAETKCISDPCKKERFFDVKYTLIDFIFISFVILIQIFGILYD
ncbi:MAG: energy-coupling factor transporter transmembrane component T [Sphaerochaetaceae bacterium]|nr:energy-coupling factor transporter transmembrane component T [Sphaerochaetaceae bacterium]MDC7238172.1 energy-coupling factor transporter transmembrane component T [Sphaerochaetaceae bacterium]